jgi:predicted permease
MLIALRLAFRQLVKAPGFTITALVTLAICLAANLVIFAVVDAVLVRSVQFHGADRLVSVFNSYPGAGVDRAGASIPNYFDRRASVKAFSSVSVFQDSNVIIGDKGAPHRVAIARVSPEFFATLDVPFAMGRTFTDAQLAYGADEVAVLTDGFWRDYFGADPKVLGRTFANDGLTITVIGVLPRDFHFLSSQAQFFRPLSHDLEDRQPKARHNNNMSMVARLAPGVTVAEAQAQMNAFNALQAKDDPLAQIVKGAGYHTLVKDLREDFVRDTKPTLVLLQAGSLLLLVIGAVNLVNLLLIRATSRTKELAVRQALGAGRIHIVRDILVETLLLGLGGGVLGLALGAFGIDLLRAFGTDRLPLGATIAVDGRVAAASLAAAVVVSLLLAAPIVWFHLHTRLTPGLQADSRGGTASRAVQRLRQAFIVAQVALAFVLLASAGLLGVSLRHVLATPAGFVPDNVLTGRISLPWKSYKDEASKLAFVERLLPAVRALPGVNQASISTGLPFSGPGSDSVVTVEGYTPKPGETLRAHYISEVAGDYWPLMRIPLLQGRLLNDDDVSAKHQVCIVDRAFADYYWPGVDPLGRRIVPFDVTITKEKATTVVGVVASVKQNDLTENTGHGAVYLPYSQGSWGSFTLAVNTALPTAIAAPMLQKAIQQLDPELPIDDLRPMQSRIDDSLVARRAPAMLAAIFAAVALLLAGIGTYGVLSYAVAQRRREIGVRMAIGAQAAQIRNQFLKAGLRLAVAGTLLGIAGAWIAGHAMQAILFGVPSIHPATLAAAIVVIGSVAVLACLVPASRASRVNPIDALREE